MLELVFVFTTAPCSNDTHLIILSFLLATLALTTRLRHLQRIGVLFFFAFFAYYHHPYHTFYKLLRIYFIYV